MPLVHTLEPIAYMIHGQQLVVNPGDLLDTDNPDDAAIIRLHPTAFHPVVATRASGVVEQATAAPGETRNVRRPH